MKVNRKALLEAIVEAKRFANSKASMPILATILLRCDASLLTVAATDLSKTYTDTIVAAEAGDLAACVDSKRLHEVIKALKGEQVELTSTSAASSAKLIIACGGSKFTLTGLPAKDYPELPTVEGLKWSQVSGTALDRIFEATCFSVCTDETRSHLNGLQLEADGHTLRAVSTDGHRLSIVECPSSLPKMTALIPRHALADVRRLFDATVEIAESKGWLFLRQLDGSGVLSVHLADATFPPWRQIIPAELNRRATVNRLDTIEALKRAMLCASDKTLCTSWTWRAEGSIGAGKLTIGADDPDKGEASETLSFTDGECLTTHAIAAGQIVPEQFKPFTIGFNGKYVLEALQHVEGETVIFEMSDHFETIKVKGKTDEIRQGELNPCRISKAIGSKDFYIVMPMKLI
jgi:DNA polymerase-3 subunit beta